jgi:hypothetical protein
VSRKFSSLIRAFQLSVVPIAFASLTLVAERNRRISCMGAARRDVDATIRFLPDRLDKIDELMKRLLRSIPNGAPKLNCWIQSLASDPF